MATKKETKTSKKKTTVRKTTSSAGKAKSKTKSSTKKTSRQTGKSSGAKNQAKVLICAKGEQCFWTNDGRILKDLNDLQAALAAMDEAVFAHHTGRGINDFADWVEQILCDGECAADLRQASGQADARTIVVHHLRSYAL